MSWDTTAVALVGTLLIFITTVWERLQNRSAIQRLALLAAARQSLPDGGSVRSDVDKTLAYLAARVERRERPKDPLRILTAGLTWIGLLALYTGGLAWAVLNARLPVPSELDWALTASAITTYAGFSASILAATGIFIQSMRSKKVSGFALREG